MTIVYEYYLCYSDVGCYAARHTTTLGSGTTRVSEFIGQSCFALCCWTRVDDVPVLSFR